MLKTIKQNNTFKTTTTTTTFFGDGVFLKYKKTRQYQYS